MNLFGALDVAQLTSLGARGVKALEDTAKALERIAQAAEDLARLQKDQYGR